MTRHTLVQYDPNPSIPWPTEPRHLILRRIRAANRAYWRSILTKRPSLPAWMDQ